MKKHQKLLSGGGGPFNNRAWEEKDIITLQDIHGTSAVLTFQKLISR